MRLLCLTLLALTSAHLLPAQERFEAGGHFGYAGFLEDDTSGGRALWGGHFGFRLSESRRLLVEYTQVRHAGDFGYRQQHNFFGLTLHTEPRPWNRVRFWADLGAGAGVLSQKYEGLVLPPNVPPPSTYNRNFGGVYAGAGIAIDVGERAFIRPGLRAYLWGPGIALGLAPAVSVGFRF